MKRFLVLTLLVFASSAYADDNVVLLLDTSTSMTENMQRGQSKMQAAKQAINEILAKMPPRTNLGLLTFNGWEIPIGPVDIQQARAAVNKVRTDGRTPLGRYMKEGADALLVERTKSHGYGTYTLLVVTDGEASDPGLLDKYIPDILSRGIILKTIGVKMAADHTLKEVSAAYYSADNLQSLQTALSKVMGEVSSTNQDATSGDYALLAGLPESMTRPVLDTLSETNMFNHPIGTPRPVPALAPAANAEAATPTEGQEGGYFCVAAMFIVGLIAIAIFVIKCL